MRSAIVRNQSCSIRSRGSAIDEKKRKTKKIGKRLCIASPVPTRSATNVPMQPNENEIDSESRIRTGIPREAGLEARPPAAKPTLM